MKKTRLLEIIREEISYALKEDLLNEIPIYSVIDQEGFRKTLDDFKEKEISKSKALNLLLTKLDDEGVVDTGQISKDLGVDTATFNNAEIRKFLARPEDERFETKTGEELIDFTPYLEKSRKERTKKVKTDEPKVTKEKTISSEPKVTKEKTTSSEPKTTPKPETSVFDSSGDSLSDLKDEIIKITTDMKDLAKKFSKAEGKEKENLRNQLKDLTKMKKELEIELEELEKQL